MGGELAYKGGIDHQVPVGSTTLVLEMESDCLVPEAEWCVCFPDGAGPFLENPAALSDSTPVAVQGMIEGKWLNRLVGDLVWKPASIGNNLLAAGAGVTTTLASIEAGDVEGDVTIVYTCKAGSRVQAASIGDLRGHNILGLARAVLEHCRSTGLSVEAVNCSARGPKSALVEDIQFVGRALAAAKVSPADLAAPAGWQRVMAEAVKLAVADGLVVEPGTAIELSVTSGGTVVGHGRMTVERASQNA
jgi:hypothetical protein